MLDSKGFDLWADGYDRAVGLSDEENTYPFAGYKEVLGRIYRTIMKKPGASVLDLGFGTGTLTAKLYENGCTVYGQDFSARMVELASAKMPDAHLYRGDFFNGLAAPLLQQKYDFIVATYSLHHLTDAQKPPFLRLLLEQLNNSGYLLIGDVAFETRAALEQCRQEAGREWDEEECYFVTDEMKEHFPELKFTKVSSCAGILSLSRSPRTHRLREIGPGEAGGLRECLEALAAHHNKVSVYFPGRYPTAPFGERIRQFEAKLSEGGYRIVVAEESGKIIGFCGIAVTGVKGVLDYLAVLEGKRGKGFGAALMGWAFRRFDEAGVREIEVKVVYGNEAINLYRKYGFREKSVILGLER